MFPAHETDVARAPSREAVLKTDAESVGFLGFHRVYYPSKLLLEMGSDILRMILSL